MSNEDSLSFEYDDEVSDSEFSFEDTDSEPAYSDLDDNDHVSDRLNDIHLQDGTSATDNSDIIFKTWKFDDFIQKQVIDKIQKLKSLSLPRIDFDDLLIMLQYKNWQPEAVIDSYYDNLEAFMESCGLVSTQKKNNRIKMYKDFKCDICCESYSSTEVFSLSCDHEYCISCYGTYVENMLPKGSLIRCLKHECQLTIPHAYVEKLIHPDFVVPQYLEMEQVKSNELVIKTVRHFIEKHSEKWKWCPAPDCDSFTQLISRSISNIPDSMGRDVNILNVPIVTCSDNHEFCYDCQYENHLPCPCWLVKKWIKKCSDDSETSNWMQANTQSCPKCLTVIEKNGGCNHMQCFKCSYEFCWICLNSWKGHVTSFYVCNRFDPEEMESLKKQQLSKRLSLQRYLHFYKRFAVHESSMKGDRKIMKKVEDKMRQYMEEQSKKNERNAILSWVDVEFLREAIRSLKNGRKTLKWTYCLAFYLNRTNFSEIFEQMQDYLSKTVEDLSLIFEQIYKNKTKENNSTLIIKKKQEIINLANVVTKRQKLLIECAKSSLTQGLLIIETE